MRTLLVLSIALLNVGGKVSSQSLPSLDDILYFTVMASDQVLRMAATDVNTTDILIRKAGFEPEVHKVITDDGYILRLTRIKALKKGPPVLMVHGLSGSSDSWLLQDRKEGLAFILANKGFDVWLADTRGNLYSRKHQSLKPDQPEFWDFSFHKIAVYDLPAFINKILAHSSYPQLSYIGHSMGTTVFFILTSTRPEYNKFIQTAVMLSPVVFFVGKIKSVLVSEALKRSDSIMNIFKRSNIYEICKRNKITETLIKVYCSEPSQLLCLNFIGDVHGENRNNMNKTRLPDYVNSAFSGTSVKSVAHYIQLIKTGEFKAFDYGRLKNQKTYGHSSPPHYRLNLITAPVVLFYSKNDRFSDYLGVEKLSNLLQNVVYKESLPKYSHIDYIVGLNAPNILYLKIISILNGVIPNHQ